MANAGIPNPELESLRDEIGKLRKEMVDFRVERAAKHLEQMRNWMGVYTPIVSLVFLAFAALGFRGLSDIQSNREKFEATSGQAAKLLADVTAKFESIKKEEEGFREQIADNATVVQQNKTVLVGFKSDLNGLERKQGELRATEAQLTTNLTGLSGQVQDLSSNLAAASRSFSASLSSSLSFTTGIGDVLSTSLNVPIITSVVVSADGGLSIQGLGFGSGGKVLIGTMRPLSGVLKSSQLPPISGQISPVWMPGSPSVELPGTLTWSDTSIVCGDVKKFFAETFHEDYDTRKVAIGIQVEVEAGASPGALGTGTKSSNVYSILPTPPPPTSLEGTVE
jgi:hypothetical protein